MTDHGFNIDQVHAAEASESKHTPGPWKYSFESVDPEWAIVTTSGGSTIANVNADHRQEANARLIARAPDLLAEVERLRATNAELVAELNALYRAYVNTLELARERITFLNGSCDPVDVMERSDPALRRAREILSSRAAIARAGGEG